MLTKLTLKQFEKITVGALRVEEQADGLHFYKCTQKQIDAWCAIASDVGERSKTTTGVRLDFHTNSKTFTFKVQTKGCYEIYIDQVLTYAFFEHDFENNKEKSIALDGSNHRITLYLPSHSVGVLEWVQLEDGATITPHTYDCKMLFLGDSITQGWESTWDSLSYAQNISRFFNAHSIIQGIGGAVFHVSTFDEELDYDPDIVIVAYGTNDWTNYKTVSEAREQCARFLECVVKKYGDKKLFGISPLWRANSHTEMSMGSFQDCVTYVKEEIKSHGMVLIDGEELVPPLPEFYTDGLHPNATGFGIYTQNLILQMQKHL